MNPSISIITPSFNQGAYIEETIDSVLSQQYPGLEYIIIDGGSTDNTVEIIRKYERHLKYWVSEKDRGQANAINKGLKHCTGELFNWLNSDDWLEAGSLNKIARAFRDPSIDLVAGKVNNFSATSAEVVANANLSAEGLICWRPDVQFIQPGVWMRREQVLQCGGIDERFHYSFDWDLLIRYCCLFPKVAYLDDLLVHFRLHEKSKTVSSVQRFAREEHLIIEKLYELSRFAALHRVCLWKMNRTFWTELLQETGNTPNRSKYWKISHILRYIYKQPRDLKVTRMTLGAFKQILTNNRIA